MNISTKKRPIPVVFLFNLQELAIFVLLIEAAIGPSRHTDTHFFTINDDSTNLEIGVPSTACSS